MRKPNVYTEICLALLLIASLELNRQQRNEIRDLRSQATQDAITLEAIYQDGFAAGKSQAAKTLPQQCTSWWFGRGNDMIKLRHKQAQTAYCSGKKSTT